MDSILHSEINNEQEMLKFLQEWRSTNLGLVDSRTIEEYTNCHISGATNIPHDDLHNRGTTSYHLISLSIEYSPYQSILTPNARKASELPPRSSKLCLISGSAQEFSLVMSYLSSHDYNVVLAGYIGQQAIWDSSLDIFTRNRYTNEIIWEPSPVLKGVIDRIESLRSERGWDSAGVALDLACGSGRDCVFLATRGWKSIGIDYLEDSLNRAKRLAGIYEVTIETVLQDLELDGASELLQQNLSAILQAQGNHTNDSIFGTIRVDLVNISRYLHRPLFPMIAEIINPGGFLVFHQFMVGCTKPKRARFLLEPGELANTFTACGFEILEDKVFQISDGRPCSWFLAQKKTF